MDPKRFVPRLVSEFGYPLKGAELVAKKFSQSAPVIQSAFLKFWDSGELEDVTVGEFSVSGLVRDHEMKPLAALLTLDWLLRDPEQAQASLQKGHDRV